MQIFVIIFGYFRWHYGKALRSLTNVWKNFLFFIFEFFSIKLLFKNFIDPWKRMTNSYPKHFSFKEYFYAFLTNLIIRIVGALLRFVLILIGLTCYILFALLYPLIIIVWICLPLIIFTLLWTGLVLIVK